MRREVGEDEEAHDEERKGHPKREMRFPWSAMTLARAKRSTAFAIALTTVLLLGYVAISSTFHRRTVHTVVEPAPPVLHEQRASEGPRKMIAIIRPFIPLHTDELVADLERWSDPHYFPCSSANEGLPVDLIFYFAYDIEDHPSGPKSKTLLEASAERASWRDCFSKVRFLSAGLNSSTDKYLPESDAEKPASGLNLFTSPSHPQNERIS